MRAAFAVFLAATLANNALGQNPAQPAGQPAAKPAAQTQPPGTPTAPPQPAAQPQPLPVPDGPVIKRTELDDGLIVEDIKIGDGYELKPGEAAVAHYHGTLKADPTKVFDSSFLRAQPMAFPLTSMIVGWQKGVPGMKVGGIRKLTVPSKLGYGERGNGPDIPGNSDLVFIIQLVDALQVEDLKVGEGEAAEGQCVAATGQVVSDKDGKEIERIASAHPYLWLPGEMLVPGMQFDTIQHGLAGMKVGGKRRLIIPKEMNTPNPSLQTNRPGGVPLTIELELVAVRNLPQQRRR